VPVERTVGVNHNPSATPGIRTVEISRTSGAFTDRQGGPGLSYYTFGVLATVLMVITFLAISHKLCQFDACADPRLE
jgi:hypothetical protein